MGGINTLKIEKENQKVRERKEQPLGMLFTNKLCQKCTKGKLFLPLTEVCSLSMSDCFPF